MLAVADGFSLIISRKLSGRSKGSLSQKLGQKWKRGGLVNKEPLGEVLNCSRDWPTFLKKHEPHLMLKSDGAEPFKAWGPLVVARDHLSS